MVKLQMPEKMGLKGLCPSVLFFIQQWILSACVCNAGQMECMAASVTECQSPKGCFSDTESHLCMQHVKG